MARNIEKAGDYIYRVPSDSSSKKYLCDVTPGSVHNCNCTDWAIKRNRLVSQGSPVDVAYACKHLRRVYEESDVADEIKAQEVEEKETQEEFDRVKAVASLRALAEELNK